MNIEDTIGTNAVGLVDEIPQDADSIKIDVDCCVDCE